MVSKKLIKEYGFNTLFEYFQYILEGRINGNFSSCREMIMQLSKVQAVDFLNWIARERKNGGNQDDFQYLHELTLQTLKT